MIVIILLILKKNRRSYVEFIYIILTIFGCLSVIKTNFCFHIKQQNFADSESRLQKRSTWIPNFYWFPQIFLNFFRIMTTYINLMITIYILELPTRLYSCNCFKKNLNLKLSKIWVYGCQISTFKIWTWTYIKHFLLLILLKFNITSRIN